MGIMGSKLIKRDHSADDKTVVAGAVAKAKRKYGHLSKPVQDATTREEMGPALRALATDLEVTNPNKSNEIISFHRRNGLTGLHPE